MLPVGDPRQTIEILRNKASQYTDEFELTPNSEIISFGAIFNNCTLTLELLDSYYSIWRNANAPPGMDVELIKKQNAERIILITKWLFIFSLSSIESSIKKLIKKSNNSKLTNWIQKLEENNKIHLDQILKSLKDTQKIDPKHYDDWATALYIRNVMVHNDGVAYNDADYLLKDFKIHLEKDKMIRGKLNFFIDISERLMEIYREFILEFELNK